MNKDQQPPEYLTIPIDLIDAHPENPRNHPVQQLEGLEESYEDLGQFRSFVVWKRPGGRYIQVTSQGITEAMREKGATHVRVEILPEDTDPLRVKRIMLADNLHAQKSHDDEELLTRLLQEQQEAGYSLLAIGSGEEALRQMLALLGETSKEREAPEEFKSYDEEIETEYCCPKCGYAWSGRPR